MTISRASSSEEYTAALGQGLGSLLRPGDVVGLYGELGAGKTTLVRAIARALGIDMALVSSPTFVLVNQYPIPAGSQPLAGGQLIHIDAYRLRSTEDLEPLGWDRFIDPAGGALGNTAVIIEWADRIADALPKNLARIELAAAGESARRLALDLPASWETREGFEQFRDREPIPCRVTGRWVSPTSKTYPFIDERTRDADMYQWFTGGYKTSRKTAPEESPPMETDERG